MRAVSVRRLKSNPTTALTAAREDDMVVVMNRDHAQALIVDLEKLGVPDVAAVRVALAVSLFKNGAVSPALQHAWPTNHSARCSPSSPASASP